MKKQIALSVVSFSLLSCLLSFASAKPEPSISFDKTALQTEGPCMSRLVDKGPRFFPTDKCRMG